MKSKVLLQQELRAYFTRGRTVTLHKGDVFLQPTVDADFTYYLDSGFVKNYTIAKDGTRNLLCIHKANDIMPLVGAFNTRPDSSFYEAMSEVQLYRLPRSMLIAATEQSTVIAQAMLQAIYEMLIIYSNRVYTLELRSVVERLAARLVLMADRFGIDSGQGILLNVPVTHQDIADSISATRETVSRELERLIRLGVVEFRNRLIIIKSMSYLKDVLG